MTLLTARQCTLRGENQCGFKMTLAYTTGAQTLLLLTQSLCVSTEFICPGLSYLDSFVQLICTGGQGGVHRYTNPSGGVVARCVLIEGTPCQPESASASVINSTQTVFNISGVQTTDAGTWSCENALNHVETCNLTVAKTPTCIITSKEDTDVLAQYQQLTLTVDIQDYYCSTALTFSLQTGNVTTLLMEADSISSITHNTSSVTLNVTDSHLGIVGLIFSCHNKRSSLTCDGVRELTETLTCSISSNKDTERLVLYEELTLTLDIVGFNCSVASYFILQTGNVKLLLDVSVVGPDFHRATTTFIMTETQLGGVRLILNCQNNHWNQTCDGITKLLNKTKTTGTPVYIAGVVGAIVFLIIVVIITITFVVKRKKVKRRVAAGYSSSDDTVHQTEENVVVGSGGSASGIDQQEPGLRINPVYIPTTVGGSLEFYNSTVTTGTSTETGVMGGDYLHSERRGEYVALDRHVVQHSNIYEHLRTYEELPIM